MSAITVKMVCNTPHTYTVDFANSDLAIAQARHHPTLIVQHLVRRAPLPLLPCTIRDLEYYNPTLLYTSFVVE